MGEMLIRPSVYEEAEDWLDVESGEGESTDFPKLDGILMLLVAENADVLAPCWWMDGETVPLTVAMNNYYQMMTEENAHSVIDDVYEFLSNQVVEEEVKELDLLLELPVKPLEETIHDDEINETTVELRVPRPRTIDALATIAIREVVAERVATAASEVQALESEAVTQGIAIERDQPVELPEPPEEIAIAREAVERAYEEPVERLTSEQDIDLPVVVHTEVEGFTLQVETPVKVESLLNDNQELQLPTEPPDEPFENFQAELPVVDQVVHESAPEVVVQEEPTIEPAPSEEPAILPETARHVEVTDTDLSVATTQEIDDEHDESDASLFETEEEMDAEYETPSVLTDGIAQMSSVVIESDDMNEDAIDEPELPWRENNDENVVDTVTKLYETDDEVKRVEEVEPTPSLMEIRPLEALDEVVAELIKQVNEDNPAMLATAVELVELVAEVMESADTNDEAADVTSEGDDSVEQRLLDYYENLFSEIDPETRQKVVTMLMWYTREMQLVGLFGSLDDEPLTQFVARTQTATSLAHASAARNPLEKLIIIGKSALRLHVAAAG